MKTTILTFFLFLMINTFLSAQIQTSENAIEILKGRLNPGNIRYQTFAATLQLMQERQVKIIVETGTTRGVNLHDIFNGDGGSTIIFADWASKNNALMYSVDIEPLAFFNAAPFLMSYQNNLVTVCNDSVEFLQNFPHTIDLLFLDSYDFDANNPKPSQEHHLKEIIAAYPKLTPNSIILIDDCGLPHGGKGKLVIKYLQERGWEIFLQGYQVLFVNRERQKEA